MRTISIVFILTIGVFAVPPQSTPEHCDALQRDVDSLIKSANTSMSYVNKAVELSQAYGTSILISRNCNRQVSQYKEQIIRAYQWMNQRLHQDKLIAPNDTQTVALRKSQGEIIRLFVGNDQMVHLERKPCVSTKSLSTLDKAPAQNAQPILMECRPVSNIDYTKRSLK
jgi:hypothetical protein